MAETVKIYDTTLRDGEQAENISFSLDDKIQIAQMLDQFGVHYIEGGWPGSNPKAVSFFKAIKKIKWKMPKWLLSQHAPQEVQAGRGCQSGGRWWT